MWGPGLTFTLSIRAHWRTLLAGLVLLLEKSRHLKTANTSFETFYIRSQHFPWMKVNIFISYSIISSWLQLLCKNKWAWMVVNADDHRDFFSYSVCTLKFNSNSLVQICRETTIIFYLSTSENAILESILLWTKRKVESYCIALEFLFHWINLFTMWDEGKNSSLLNR